MTASRSEVRQAYSHLLARLPSAITQTSAAEGVGTVQRNIIHESRSILNAVHALLSLMRLNDIFGLMPIRALKEVLCRPTE
jgi:hypothetical protein